MSHQHATDYYAGLNPALLRAVPADARTILEIGCSQGRLGAALKSQRPDRIVFGVEQHQDSAQQAATVLDQVFTLDIQTHIPPLAPQSLDCLICGDVLEHLLDPLEVLTRLRILLKPDGWLVASIPNLGHHSVLAALAAGDWQYQPSGLLDRTHLRFFTFASALKLFLDAGFTAEIVETIFAPLPEPLRSAWLTLASRLQTSSQRLQYSLESYQFIVKGQLLPPVSQIVSRATVAFSVCVSREEILAANFLASPELALLASSQVLLTRGAPSAAAGHNAALAHLSTDWVFCVHEDVYLPQGWLQRMLSAIAEAEQRYGTLDVVGVYGVATGSTMHAGLVVDRSRLLRGPACLPALVHSLDELVLAVRPSSGLRFDPALGWHLYGTDLCLAALKAGRNAAAVEALCLHNSRAYGLPPEFKQSAHYLAQKWPARMPLTTACGEIKSL